VRRFSVRQNFPVRFANDLVGKLDHAVPRFRDARPDAQDFIVDRRVMIPAVRIGNHDAAVILDFHAFVLNTQCAHQFDASDLKPDQVICVVHHAHLIRLRVAHAHRCVMIFDHSDNLMIS